MRKRLITALALMFIWTSMATGCARMETLVHPIYFETVQSTPSGVSATVPQENLAREISTSPRKAVILPFADYSPHDSPQTHVNHHDILQRNLVNALRDKGIKSISHGMAVSEFLIERGIILDPGPFLLKESPRTSMLFSQIKDGDWSPLMAEIMGRMAHQNLIAAAPLPDKLRSRALDREAVREIGAYFDANYVVRGRMTVFQSGLKWDTFPHPEEVLAFYFTRPGKKAPIICLSTLAAYEWFEGGPSTPPPSSTRSEYNLPFRRDSRKFAPLVRLDLFIQETVGGDVVYSESAEARVSQVYTMSRPRHSHELEQYLGRAVPKAVAWLVKGLD